MNPSDLEIFSHKVSELCELYGQPFNDKRVELYFRLLQDYDIDTVVAGIDATMITCKFFPKPAEIVEIIEGKENEIIDFSYQEAKAIFYDGFHFAKRLKNKISMQVIADMGGQHEFYKRVYIDGENDNAAYFEFKRIFKRYYRLARAGLFQPSVQYLPGYMNTLEGAAPVDWARLPEVSHGPSRVLIENQEQKARQIGTGA